MEENPFTVCHTGCFTLFSCIHLCPEYSCFTLLLPASSTAASCFYRLLLHLQIPTIDHQSYSLLRIIVAHMCFYQFKQNNIYSVTILSSVLSYCEVCNISRLAIFEFSAWLMEIMAQFINYNFNYKSKICQGLIFFRVIWPIFCPEKVLKLQITH